MDVPSDRIELLSVSLLEQHAATVQSFMALSAALDLNMGWHYPLDFSWAIDRLQPVPGMTVLDAGAGYGAMQWWLAGQGCSVVSVDRSDRSTLNTKMRAWCPVHGLRRSDLKWLGPVATLQMFARSREFDRYPPGFLSRRQRGTVSLYNQDLSTLRDIPDDSVDAIVSISALEHNTLDGLRICVTELMRVLKPGGRLVATLAAAKTADWYHDASSGWCLCEGSLRELFALPADCFSDFAAYDTCFAELRGNRFLQENLAPSYFLSGNNGMPWGVWNPRYQPVGVVKVKR